MSARESTLREVVERLAPLERGGGSDGERAAAEWIRDRLEQAGAEARIEEERFHTGYARQMAALSGVGVGAGVLGVLGIGRRLAAAAGAAAAVAIADDAANGARPVRRHLFPELATQNVVAEIGPADAPRTIVVMAHHDAAPTGAVFDQSGQQAFARRFPGIVERMDTALPIWWPVIGAPAIAAAGAAKRSRRLAALGLGLSAGAVASFLDIARDRIVPGANDNLSAVACLVVLAEALRDEPAEGIRVLLVSYGAEEVLQGGIHGFAKRHFSELDRATTYFLNLDTVGSPRLALLEGEGIIVMEDYFDKTFRDLVANVANRERIRLRRGLRARSSTDSVIPSRARFPTATLVSVDKAKALSNYHQMSDTPENLDYATVADAAALSEAVIRELADEPGRR